MSIAQPPTPVIVICAVKSAVSATWPVAGMSWPVAGAPRLTWMEPGAGEVNERDGK